MKPPVQARLVDGGIRELSFWQPTHPISTNKANQLHWSRRTRELTPWRDATFLYAQDALRTTWAGLPIGPLTIRVRLEFRTQTRRDPHNYVGTVVKSIVDGLVRAGVIPDDTAQWATIMDPELVHQPDRSEPLRARITLTPRSPT